MKRIALIPARGGSKGVPFKNIAYFNGLPLIAHSIAFALRSGEFDHVVVSTDSEIVREIALHFGAEVPFLRPPEISGDLAKDIDVVRHCVEEMGLFQNALTVLLQPTAPERKCDELTRGLEACLSGDFDAAWSVDLVPLKFHYRKLLKNTGKLAVSGDPNPMRQELDDCFIRNGQFYIHRVEHILAGVWLPDRLKLIKTTPGRNIDTLEDLLS